MFTTVDLGAVPHATANGSLALTISMITTDGETLDGLRAHGAASGQPVYRPVTINAQIGDHRLDLGVRAEKVEITALPHGVDRLASTEPIASLLAEYRERLAATAIRLATYGFATANRVTAAFNVTDLRHLSQYLSHAENLWRAALTRAQNTGDHPPLGPSAWFSTTSTTAPPSGGDSSAWHASTELSRVEQFHRWFGRLLDLAQHAAEHEQDGPR